MMKKRSKRMNKIKTSCPSCGSRSLFIGTGGHLTCSWLNCPEPGVERAIAALKREKEQQAQTIVECQNKIAELALHADDLLTAEERDAE